MDYRVFWTMDSMLYFTVFLFVWYTLLYNWEINTNQETAFIHSFIHILGSEDRSKNMSIKEIDM